MMSGMKRLVVAALWLYTLWCFGSMVAFVVGVPDLLGPVLGLTGGLIVGIDPRHLIWARDRATRATAQTGSTVASVA